MTSNRNALKESNFSSVFQPMSFEMSHYRACRIHTGPGDNEWCLVVSKDGEEDKQVNGIRFSTEAEAFEEAIKLNESDAKINDEGV